MIITTDTSRAELAGYVCQQLADHGIIAVLTGGSVVSIYSENQFQSDDLDFITEASLGQLRAILGKLGFSERDKYFCHPATPLVIEFPRPPLAIGDRQPGMHELSMMPTPYGALRILTPTQCVIDRLSAYYFWDDAQCLLQAVAVARRHPVTLEEIAAWSDRERMRLKYERFLALLAGAR